MSFYYYHTYIDSINKIGFINKNNKLSFPFDITTNSNNINVVDSYNPNVTYFKLNEININMFEDDHKSLFKLIQNSMFYYTPKNNTKLKKKNKMYRFNNYY